MRRQIRLRSVLVLLVVTVCSSAPAPAGEGPQPLDQASKLFEQNRLQDAQQAFTKIQKDKLSQDDQARYDELDKKLTHALTLSKKAQNDFAAAEQFRKSGKPAEAVKLYQAVVENEFASAELSKSSLKRLAGIKENKSGRIALASAEKNTDKDQGDKQGDKKDPPDIPAGNQAEAKAAQLVKRGRQAIQDTRYDEAIASFDQALTLVPGLPEAVHGKEQALQHKTAQDPEKMSLVQKLRQRDNILWNRAVSKYRQLDEQIRENIIQGDFEQADRLMQGARQVIERTRQHADPIEKYESLKREANALAAYLADEQRRWHEEEIRRRRDEARQIQQERLAHTQKQREEKIQVLMDQAYQLKKEREYNGAIEVLKQVRAIDPTNDQARYMIDLLEDTASMQEQLALRYDHEGEFRQTAIDADRSAIPWHKDILFPSNWLEITARRTAFAPGEMAESPENRALQEKLQQTIPEVAFDETPFESILEFLDEQNGVNIYPNWNALEIAGIERDVDVAIKLENVRLEKALELILEYVGGGDVELGFILDEGIIRISTQEDLNTKTYTEVYDIRDIIVQIPSNYDAPQMDLNQIIQAAGQQGGGGGQSPFRENQQQTQAQQMEDEADQLIEGILELIRSTIDPDSWRENGGIVGSAREMSGLLVVTQTAGAHKALQDLLTKLRGPKAIQIAIETRFLTVRTNFLEEIGTDLDIILNAGNAGYDFIGGRDTEGNPLPPITDPSTGGRLLIPREFTRLGVLPQTTPSGIPFLTQGAGGGAAGANPFVQPYGQVGIVPGHGQVGPHSSQWTPIPLLSNTMNLTDPANATTGVPGTFGGGNLVGPAFQAFGSFLDNIQVDFLLRATQADQRSTLLTAPKIVLFNGQRSYVAVTQTQAYISDLDIVVGTQAAAPDPQVSSVASGTVLEVEATVSADRRYVILTIAPRIARIIGIADFPVVGSALTVASGIIQLPEVQVTTLKTSVSVPDGGTVLLGGQKLSGEVEIEAGVPILSKIPGLKQLYSNRTLVKDEETLLILVQPKIIIQEETEEEAFPSTGIEG